MEAGDASFGGSKRAIAAAIATQELRPSSDGSDRVARATGDRQLQRGVDARSTRSESRAGATHIFGDWIFPAAFLRWIFAALRQRLQQ